MGNDEKELVERLRAFAKKWGAAEGRQDGELQLANEAASTIERLEQERDALREALRPFATCIDRLAPGDDIAHWRLTDALNHGLTVAHVHAAAVALNQTRPDAVEIRAKAPVDIETI